LRALAATFPPPFRPTLGHKRHCDEQSVRENLSTLLIPLTPNATASILPTASPSALLVPLHRGVRGSTETLLPCHTSRIRLLSKYGRVLCHPSLCCVSAGVPPQSLSTVDARSAARPPSGSDCCASRRTRFYHVFSPGPARTRGTAAVLAGATAYFLRCRSRRRSTSAGIFGQ
jgi:hypothetical protein